MQADKIALGHRAASLMADPAYAAAVERAEASLFASWKAETDPKKREAIWARCNALTLVTQTLSALKQDGAVAFSRTK